MTTPTVVAGPWRLLIAAAAIVAAAAIWIGAFRDDGVVDSPNSSDGSRPSSADDPTALAGGSNDASGNAIELSARGGGNASTSPFFPIWSTSDARDALRNGDQLERILTPVSEQDEAWMIAYAYPRPQDYRTRGINALEKAFEEAGNDGRPLGRSSRDYAANALAAAKWEAKDPTWIDWARRSQSPFAHALIAADAMATFRTDPTNSNARIKLMQSISSAYARGERALALDYLAEASMYAAFSRGPNVSMVDLFNGFAQIEIMNARMRAAGVPRPPMEFEPRPAPTWSIYGQQLNSPGGKG